MDSIRYRLGLDVGSTSLGWWIWEEDDSGEVIRSVDGGVRIYSDSRDPKTGTSLAADRRVARGMRRRRDRYLKRRSRLMDNLVQLGLMPSESSERKKLELLNPYSLRVRALDEPLKPFELGRALFHLNQRRGFQSNRIIDAGSDEKEQGKVSGGISTLDKKLEQSECRTIGEYLSQEQRAQKPLRFRPGVEIYPSRKHYKSEFNLIRQKQEPIQHLSHDCWNELEETIFFQRPLRPIKPGKCTLFPEEDRAPLALPISQHFRILQELNNLKIVQIGEKDRRLSREEQKLAFNALLSQAKLSFASLPKKLKLRLDSRFNLEDEKRKHLDGDKTAAVLRKSQYFGKGWDDKDTLTQSRIVNILLDDAHEDEVVKVLEEQFCCSDEVARTISRARLPQGYGNLSEKAMEAIVPYLKEGFLYHEAVKKAFPDKDHTDVDDHYKVDFLPYYPELLERHVSRGTNKSSDEVFTRLGKIANPTVHVGLNQIRNVVNAIIVKYGPPSRIMVELARDLKNSLEEKQKISRRQAEEQKKNERRRTDLENCGRDPNAGYVRKVRLWEEQGLPQARCCPYCGTILSYEMVLDDRTQIDHILPFSRTLDDSLANKVVCCRRCNQIKRNQTPYEAFGSNKNNEFDYDKMLVRVSSNWPNNKKWRFYPDAMDRVETEERGFLDRQLNDTRYLSRITKTYLQYLFDSPSQVSVNPGNLTALIRGKWGLNSILADSNYKLRTDHRHHAIDAAVIALIDRSMLQRVSSSAAAGVDVHRFLPNMPDPPKCRNFRDQIKDHALNNLVVCHRPRHVDVTKDSSGTLGQLHNDTAFGIIAGPDSKGKFVVVRRILLSALNQDDGNKLLSGLAKRKKIIDEDLRKRLQTAWHDFAGKQKSWKQFCEYVSKPGCFTKTGVRSVRCEETKDSLIEIRNRNGDVYKGYKPDSNARMDILKLSNGSYKGQTATMYEAHQKFVQPKWQTKYPTARHVIQLYINDLVAIGEGFSREILRVVKLSGANIWSAPAYEGGDLQTRDRDLNDPFKYVQMSAPKFIQAGLRKVKVDPLGKIFDPGPILDRV